jgi:poly-gamma-glutamate capsule biosynthesis protein CapA/YwtB (metallophosphatase superfamily)
MPFHNTLRIQWLGDIALTERYCDPTFHDSFRANVTRVATELDPADVRIVNWEAPLLADEGSNPEKELTIHTVEEAAKTLTAIRVDVALLANNHAFDCLLSGFEKTLSFFASRGVRWVGAGRTQAECSAPLLMDVQGKQLAILNYVGPETHPWLPNRSDMCLNMLEPDRVLDEVSHWSKRSFAVLVNFHWGMDFLSLPAPEHRSLARKAIDAGATTVVGHHPHCLQGYERRGKGLIFYSLGNFLAGSIYPWPRFSEPTVSLTCAVEAHRVVDFRIQPFTLRDGILAPDSSNRCMNRLEVLNRRIQADEKRYARYWAGALAYNLALFRPYHFVRRNRNPLKILSNLKRRHAREYMDLIRRAFCIK